ESNAGPSITNPGNQGSNEGQSVNLPILATDPDGDDLTFTAENLPPGLSIDAGTGVISDIIQAGALANSPYTVTVTVTDPDDLSASTSFIWAITDQFDPVPVNLNAAVTPYEIAFSWTHKTASGATSVGGEWYNLYVMRDGGIVYNRWYRASEICA